MISQDPSSFYEKEIRFVGEQEGEPERELKTRLKDWFSKRHDVSSAHLVRVQYGGSKDTAPQAVIRQMGIGR